MSEYSPLRAAVWRPYCVHDEIYGTFHSKFNRSQNSNAGEYHNKNILKQASQSQISNIQYAIQCARAIYKCVNE